MTYEECEQLVTAFEDMTLLKDKLSQDQQDLRSIAVASADAIGEFIASMMAQAWKVQHGKD